MKSSGHITYFYIFLLLGLDLDTGHYEKQVSAHPVHLFNVFLISFSIK